MNILMVTPDYPPVFGGIGTHVYELCNQLNGKGLHITIALFRLGRNPLIDQITYGQSVTHSVISEDIDFLEVDTSM